ncbi:MAG: hypothetical protein AAF990_06305 [Bacteroidota bacterium]
MRVTLNKLTSLSNSLSPQLLSAFEQKQVKGGTTTPPTAAPPPSPSEEDDTL